MLITILSDPSFTLYKILGVETLVSNGNEFKASISLGLISLILHGLIFIGTNKVSYKFYTVGVRKGEGGILEFDLSKAGEVKLIFEYEVILKSLILFSLKRKISKNIKNFDEEIKLERVKRKIKFSKV